MEQAQTTQNLAVISCIKFNGYKVELSTNLKGQPVARAYKFMTMGKNKGQYNLLEGYYFRSEERREEWIKAFMDNVKRIENDKAERQQAKKAARENMQHNFKVGQIYYDSWGYDQTNIDFYQITEVKAKSVVIREIAAEYVPGTQGMDCSNVRPIKDKFVGEAQLKPIVVSVWGKEPQYRLKSRHGSISLYTKEDKGVYSSWYH